MHESKKERYIRLLKSKSDLPSIELTSDAAKEILEILEQSEIIRCKNCKHNQLPSTSGNAICEIFYGMTDREGFCHMAERRTDDQT